MRWSLALIVILHLSALAADILAPYDYSEQTRTLSFAPPTQIHFFDDQGRFHPRPFVYELKRNLDHRHGFEEDRAVAYPIRFWVPSEPRSIGPIRISFRFFGTDSPTGVHLWGTDRFGRDLFSRTLYGARLSLFAGMLAGSLAVLLGLIVGSVSALAEGVTDTILMRAAEVTMSLPWMYLLIGARAFLPLRMDPELVFVLTITLVGTLAWALPARLTRGVMLSAKEQDYVTAAIGFGATKRYLLFKHLLPEAKVTLWTQWALLVPRCILAEVTLSFFGLGAQEPAPSLGSMLAVLTQFHGAMSRAWMFSPVVALGLAILSYHLLAEAVGKLESN